MFYSKFILNLICLQRYNFFLKYTSFFSTFTAERKIYRPKYSSERAFKTDTFSVERVLCFLLIGELNEISVLSLSKICIY